MAQRWVFCCGSEVRSVLVDDWENALDAGSKQPVWALLGQLGLGGRHSRSPLGDHEGGVPW